MRRRWGFIVQSLLAVVALTVTMFAAPAAYADDTPAATADAGTGSSVSSLRVQLATLEQEQADLASQSIELQSKLES